MKALFCADCSVIISGPTDGSWRWCDCGNAAIRWTDPVRGKAEVWAENRRDVRIIGLHNGMLQLPFETVGSMINDWDGWRELHQHLADAVDPGYLFHADKRACWAVVIRPGDSNDTRYADERPER